MNIMYITVDPDIQEKFEMALKLTGEEKNNVFDSFMRSYIAQSFSKVAGNYTPNKHESVNKAGEQAYFGKALDRIPKWANKPHQINHKILRAYLQLLQETPYVTRFALAHRCSDSSNHADVYVPTFESNYAQMKFDGSNSHGKVFEEDANGNIVLWSYVHDMVMAFADQFLA